MLRPKSVIRHISFIEFNQMMNSLAETVRSSGLKVQGLTPIDKRDLVPAALLAYKLDVPINNNSTTFSIYSDSLPNICMFKKTYESDHYNVDSKAYLEEIDVEEDGYHQKIVFEWEKI